MPMTGVMPLPAVTSAACAAPATGSTNSPIADSSRTIVPTGVSVHEMAGDDPALVLLDGDAQLAVALGAAEGVDAPVAHAVDVDADADVLAGPWPVQVRPGRMVRVAAREVSRWTSTTRPRSSVIDPQRVDEPEEVLGEQGGRQRRERRASTRDVRRRGGAMRNMTSPCQMLMSHRKAK